MEIKSTLLNDKDFEWVKNSILNADSIDGEGDFKVKLIEYINDTSYNDDDMFFYDMLTNARFLKPGSDSIAYTNPDKLIFLNAPCEAVGKNYRLWDFIYDHECLHQLWDTFAVGEKIKTNGIKYDHTLLNIVSDCIINDYLSRIRKKDQAPNTITPEYLKEKYGVNYDHKVDTQYSLYLKCLEELENIKKDPFYVDPDKKLKPKQVNKNDGPTPPPPPQGKHSEDFKRGWVDAIKDVVNKKVDPTDSNLKPKDTGNSEYDKGYNSAIAQMKEGLENGIDISSGGDNNSSGGSDLPDIPWDMDNDNDQSGDSQSGDDSNDESDKSSASNAAKSAQEAQDAADAAKKAADAAQDAADAANEAGDPNASDIQDAADKAKNAAEHAQEAADEAKEAANKAADAEEDGDSEGAAKAAQDAADAADKAKEAANEAGDATKQAGETASESDDEATQEAGEKAQNEGENAKDSAKDGKDGDSNDGKNGKNNNNKSKGWGTGHVAPVESKEDLEKIRKNAEDIINEYKNKLSGKLGEFISKCKSSARGEKDGLATNVSKGVKGWNTELDQRINKYVKQKVFQKKRQWESTYSRVKRGTGYVKQGEVLQPGRRIKDDTLIINVAFYLDRSGSMGTSLDTVFKACYIICEALKKRYRKEKVVEDILFKILAFDTNITEIKYGKKCSLGGGTMAMSDLLQSIKKYSNDFMINVVITDGEFDINNTEVKKFINDVNGIVIYIVNRKFPEMQKLAKELNTKLFFIEADSSFKIN